VETLEQQDAVKANTYRPFINIVIEAYNNLTYTKLCIESLYKNTSHIDFELIMINNGSNDGTAEYFSTLEKARIITFSQYAGTAKAFNEALKHANGEYILFTHNNIIFTHNWLDNLITCIKSHKKTGMAVPASNLDTNSQQVGLYYKNLEEMYEAAKNYNSSDPDKWEERLKLAAYVFLTGTELVKKLGGFTGYYFHCGFEEADLCFRMRRAGYKLIFAGDTYVHHFGLSTVRDDFISDNLLKSDSKVFLTKFEVDSEEDTYIDHKVVNLIDHNRTEDVNILGIGSSCGGTVLQVKNMFLSKGVRNAKLWYLTEDKKYIPDLKSICDNADCTCAGNILNLYEDEKFDCIVIDKQIQLLENPEILLKKIKSIMKNDGQMIFSQTNETYYANIKKLINVQFNIDGDKAAKHCLNPEEMKMLMKKYGYTEINYYYNMNTFPVEDSELVERFKTLSAVKNKDELNAILCSKKMIFTAKVKKNLKTVLLYPGYDFWLNDAFFEQNIYGNQLGADVGKDPFAMLRDELYGRGYRLCTIDGGDIEDAEHILFIDMPKSYDNNFYRHMYHYIYKGKVYFEQCLNLKKEKDFKLILFMQEPPFVMPENFDKSSHECFDAVITFDDGMIDNKKYFKYLISEPTGVKNKYPRGFDQKKLLTLIDSNKNSDVPGELYSRRREAIAYFEKNHIDCFDFYGKGWECCGYKSYKGPVPGKMEVLSRYKFCICYENGMLNGFITEKIFDCFFSECVPIYLGAPNIMEYIPEDTFIDMRRFDDYEDMYCFISSIREEKYNKYLNNIKDFLDSDKFARFSHTSFAKNMADILERLKNE